MRVSTFYKKYIGSDMPSHSIISFATMDKDHDDFHILPTPTVCFAKTKSLIAFAIGVKWGFWGFGLWLPFLMRHDFMSNYFKGKK